LAGRFSVVLGELGVASLRCRKTGADEVLAETELLAAERADDKSHTAGVPVLTAQIGHFRIVPFLAVAVTVLGACRRAVRARIDGASLNDGLQADAAGALKSLVVVDNLRLAGVRPYVTGTSNPVVLARHAAQGGKGEKQRSK
jgi:hypothetical protein